MGIVMELIFKTKKQELGGIYSFIFTPVKEIKWIAGQTIGLELETEFLTEERHFTISSSPYEKDIVITTQVSSSDFKQALDMLESGDKVRAFAIAGGDFVWEDKPSVFIAGGMGITPYFSILKQLAHERRDVKRIQLFYSAKKEKLLFKKELQQLAEKIKNVNINFFIDERISMGRIEKQINNLENKKIYIAGPSKMVDDFSDELVKKFHIKEEDFKRDWFTGL